MSRIIKKIIPISKPMMRFWDDRSPFSREDEKVSDINVSLIVVVFRGMPTKLVNDYK